MSRLFFILLTMMYEWFAAEPDCSYDGELFSGYRTGSNLVAFPFGSFLLVVCFEDWVMLPCDIGRYESTAPQVRGAAFGEPTRAVETLPALAYSRI
jgi:hypothetical protein